MQCLQNLSITIWIRLISMVLSLSLLGVTGCASKMSGQMPSDGIPMAKIYQQAIGGGGSNDNEPATLNVLRSQVAQPIVGVDFCSGMIQNNRNNLAFHRGPNPDVRMYVYPHWVGDDSDEIHVPGYWIVFPFYLNIQYNIL